MKKLLFILCTTIFAVGCNDKSGSTDAKSSDTTKVAETKMEKIDYPYTLDRPYQDWQPGDQKHAVTVMSALKGFENGDIAASMKGFGDSINIRFDGFRQKFSHDSLATFFTGARAQYASLKIDMGDWESVISKDGKEEWVTLWYKQNMTDKKGKADSLAVINDFKIVNGKIVELDEKIQHFPAAKK